MTGPTKVCSRCRVRKPWSRFRQRTGAGYPISWCRECERRDSRERARARRAADPAANAAECARYYAAVRADPERFAALRMRQRDARGIPPERWRSPRLHGIASSPRELVASEPFAAWLAERAAEVGVRPLARRVGKHETHVRDWIAGKVRSVDLATVDRAVTAWGDPDAINRLYPLPDASSYAAPTPLKRSA